MSFTPAIDRRLARHLARLGVVGSTVMLVTTVLGLSPAGLATAGAAGVDSGVATLIHPEDGTPDAGDPLTSGNSSTAFSLALPSGASCIGDSANDGWNVTSFMVPSSVDVAGLQFLPLAGPNPPATGASFRQPLFVTPTGDLFVGQQTANADTVGGPGRIINTGPFDLASGGFTPGQIPAGAYKVGIACIKGPASATQLSRFWTATMTITASDTTAGGPAAVTFTAAAPTGTTTTTAAGGTTSTTAAGGTTSTTAAGGTTSTTAAGGTTSTTTSGSSSTTSTTACASSTSTTSASSTSTTTASSTSTSSTPTSSTSTSSTLPSCSTTSTTSASGGSTGGPSSNPLGSGALPSTGTSPAEGVMWAFVLLVCGRMAVVLSRPPKVPSAD